MLPHNFHIIHFYISFLNLSCRGNVIYLINVLQLKVSTLYSNKKKRRKRIACWTEFYFFIYLLLQGYWSHQGHPGPRGRWQGPSPGRPLSWRTTSLKVNSDIIHVMSTGPQLLWSRTIMVFWWSVCPLVMNLFWRPSPFSNLFVT